MDPRLLYLVFGVALLIIRDKNNRPIGHLEQRGDRTFVRDVNYKLLGYTDKRGTFDPNWIKLFNSPAPVLLLKCK